MNLKERLLGLLEGNSDPKLESKLRNIIKSEVIRLKAEDLLRSKIGDDYLDEVYSDVLLRLLIKKEYISSLEYINYSYIRAIIRNLLIDLINGGKVEVNLQSMNFEDDEGKEVDMESVIPDTRKELVEVEIRQVYDSLFSNLEDKDLMVLCYYVGKLMGLEPCLEGISKDALYKRWERLRKEKLRELFYGLDGDEFRELLNMFLSEFCQKRGYIKDIAGA